MDDSLEHVETAEDAGLSVDEYRELPEELRTLGVSVGDDVIPSTKASRRSSEARGCDGHKWVDFRYSRKTLELVKQPLPRGPKRSSP